MKNFIIVELAQVMNGKVLCGNLDTTIESFLEQCMRPQKNSLCFLLDGYENEEKLLSRLTKYGVAGIVIKAPHRLNLAKWADSNIAVIEVKSVRDAYLAAAKYYRSTFQIPFIQVIGSSGKSTTKEMIGAILRANMSTLISYQNFNAPSGVAYTLFRLKQYHQAAVLEAGMKDFGIMATSSSMIMPNIAVVTSIHRSHYTSLGSIENIIKAKGELLDYIDDKGVLIINGEDKNCEKLPFDHFKGKILRFGFSEGFNIWASDIRYENFKTYFKAHTKDLVMDCTLNTFGKYNVTNALASILVGLELGLTPEMILKGLSNYKPLEGRLQILPGIKNSTLIHDNYNANPDSTKLLLQELPLLIQDLPLIIVLGDMESPKDKIEKYAREVHYLIGQQLSSIDFLHLFAIGKWAEEYIKGAEESGVDPEKLSYYRKLEDAQAHIISSIPSNGIVLFKAAGSYIDFQKFIYLIRVKP